MATPNVIDYPTFSKYPAPTYSSAHCYFVREEEPESYSALSGPLWPRFPDGAYLKSAEASRFYRTTQGLQGLVHVLNRSIYLRSLTSDYENEPDRSLGEVQESKLWAALIEIGADLGRLADDLYLNSENPKQ
jgi:hypothetical protein